MEEAGGAKPCENTKSVLVVLPCFKGGGSIGWFVMWVRIQRLWLEQANGDRYFSLSLLLLNQHDRLCRHPFIASGEPQSFRCGGFNVYLVAVNVQNGGNFFDHGTHIG